MNHSLYAHLLVVVRAGVVLASLEHRLGQHLTDLLLEVGTRIPGPMKAFKQKSDVIYLMCLFFT